MSSFKRLLTRGAVAALALTSGVTAVVEAPTVVPGAYIVEFEDDSTGSVDAFYANVSDSGIAAAPRVELSHELFKGASFRLDTAVDEDSVVATIQSFAQVKKIWPVRLFSNPANILGNVKDLASLQLAASEAASKKRSVSDSFSTHVMTGVDKLREEGFTGEGIYIGVVDTGIDYLHPALGGGFGPGFKVVAGYDLVGNAYTGSEVPVPDDDPMDCGGHGTHVSGIIGANLNEFNFTGVAPNATLGAWKVFGCTGQVSTDVLIQAFNMAYEAGVDIISASIGGPSGWTEDAWDVAVQRIAEKGVPCIIAAGNDGALGMFNTASASESIGATSVGSIDNTEIPAFLTRGDFAVGNGSKSAFGYAPSSSFADFGTISVPLYAPTLDTTVVSDACTALPADTPDLSEYLVLIKRGTCTFDVKIANAVAFGAKRIMFYNNIAVGATAPGDSSLTIPAGMVEARTGAAWIEALKAGSKVTVSLVRANETSQFYSTQPNPLSAGKMSTFSTWGPSYEMWLKPEVSAPGGIILSTYPRAKGSFSVASGTSMATPFISGVVALLKQIRGKKSQTPFEITSLLASTASPVRYSTGSGESNFLAPVFQQGGGLVNAYQAAHTTTTLSLDNIALNDTAHFVADHPVTVTNIGDSAQTYYFTHEIAPTAYTMASGGIVPQAFPGLQLETDAASAASVSFDSASVTVPAKSSASVIVSFTPPAGLDTSRFPLYSGYIKVNGTNGDALSLPYGGLAANLKDFFLMDIEAGFPYIATTSNIDLEIAPNTTFTLPGKNGNSTANQQFPTIAFALAMGSRVVRLDVVPVNGKNVINVLGRDILGSLPGSPVENVPRYSGNTPTWNGQLDDESWAPAGSYKILLRALKITGDVTKAEDYESYESVAFNIRYQ